MQGSMEKLLKYGKSSGALIRIKEAFFAENDERVQWSQKIADIYTAQPRRVRCKCCGYPLEGATFTKQSVEYIICNVCSHLNGANEDTDAFCAHVYTSDDGTDYAKNYSAADRDAYMDRVAGIYAPKVEFLCDALKHAGKDPNALRFSDFGGGSGHFVCAMRAAGLAARGYDVSPTQVRFGNQMIGDEAMSVLPLGSEVQAAGSEDADVVSLIGVLEHVQHPRDTLSALRQNPRVKYIYLSVPLFSPCVMFEAVFPEIMQRQLSGAHTHLYTEESLNWTSSEFGLRSVAEWWFGTDMVDLFRSVQVSLSKNAETAALAEYWSGMMLDAVDPTQFALDNRRLSSEVHMLLEFEDAAGQSNQSQFVVT